MAEVKPDSETTRALLEQLAGGDRQALEPLLARHRPDLASFIDFHLDAALRARLDPSDVVQEAQLEVARRMDDFLERRPMPFHLWVRKTAYQRLLNAPAGPGPRPRGRSPPRRPPPDARRCCRSRHLVPRAPRPAHGAGGER